MTREVELEAGLKTILEMSLIVTLGQLGIRFKFEVFKKVKC